ncbi:hypothetical protein HYFRA_00007173 [Hymenoscyphus fraxineus]|uniref:Uncharacterized protein n=1 Tax=Hymenoscyphus fraxineus TaxID=746836 RepID=A0A9N9L046_9HELO|nr:hypothetical protein HYFRA_00007173 [Hymenoscyphus fraxineus]
MIFGQAYAMVLEIWKEEKREHKAGKEDQGYDSSGSRAPLQRRRLKKGSINQRIGFRLGSGWIHHSSHLEVGRRTPGIGHTDTREYVWFVVVLIDRPSRSYVRTREEEVGGLELLREDVSLVWEFSSVVVEDEGQARLRPREPLKAKPERCSANTRPKSPNKGE